jgi:hypothetical protein
VEIGPGEAVDRGRMRAGHADREQVITELKAAFVQGRLDQDELEERAARAVAARTYAELAALTAVATAVAAGTRSAAGSPGRTFARGAKRAGICLLAAIALTEAAALANNFLLIVMAAFAALAALAAGGFLGYGIIDAIKERSVSEAER